MIAGYNFRKAIDRSYKLIRKTLSMKIGHIRKNKQMGRAIGRSLSKGKKLDIFLKVAE